jgi:hypothetical protein
LRTIWGLAAAVGMAIAATSAHGQFGVPFGGPALLTSPEAASGAIGAGAAQGVARQQDCLNVGVGRDRPRGPCVANTPPARAKR